MMSETQGPGSGGRGPGKTGPRRTFVALVAGCCLLAAAASGCAPTYPKGKFKESIIRICKSEYKLDVKVGMKGKTVVIYLPLPDLIDFTFAITKSASEKINDVILSVTRVALSTDAQVDFYCIIAHDIRIPEIQIVIIKSVDDVKRFLLNDISRDDYAKRMLIDMRLNPQAQKERSVREVFEKMALDQKWQEQVMNEFFRSEPTALSDIGYWNGRFFIKDITQPEFLAEQISSRMRVLFREEKAYADTALLKSVKTSYAGRNAKKSFRIEALAQPKVLPPHESDDVARDLFRAAVQTAATVLHIYRFDDFEYIEIADLGTGKSIRVARAELEAARRNRKKLESLVRKENN